MDSLLTRCMLNKSPSLILFNSTFVPADPASEPTTYKFGAYLSHPIRLAGNWTGSPACFLFSATLDTKLPFHNRTPPQGAHDAPVAFLVEREQLVIGNGDLRIGGGSSSDGAGGGGYGISSAGNLARGSSDLESCFGLGMATGSSEALCFLAGSREFEIDAVEVWAVMG